MLFSTLWYIVKYSGYLIRSLFTPDNIAYFEQRGEVDTRVHTQSLVLLIMNIRKFVLKNSINS